MSDQFPPDRLVYLQNPLTHIELDRVGSLLTYDGDPCDRHSKVTPRVLTKDNKILVIGNDHSEALGLLIQFERLGSDYGQYHGVKMPSQTHRTGFIVDAHLDFNRGSVADSSNLDSRYTYDSLDPKTLNASWIDYYLQRVTQTPTTIYHLCTDPRMNRSPDGAVTLHRGRNQILTLWASTIQWDQFGFFDFVSIDIDAFNDRCMLWDTHARNMLTTLMQKTNVFTVYTSPSYRHGINLDQILPTIVLDWLTVADGSSTINRNTRISSLN